MNRFRWLAALLFVAAEIGCGGQPSHGGATAEPGDGVIESIDHIDKTASAGVAGVLAGGSLSTPTGNGALKPAGSNSNGLVAGAVASAITQPAPARPHEPGYRVNVRLDSGGMRSIDLADVAALRIGQRVHVEGNQVLPR